jgi:cystinosin
VYLNYKRKSTVGWSITNIILDFIGGSFSVLQDVIRAIGDHKSPFDGGGFNIVKWMLGIMSMVFDIIFMIQHYVLYRNNHPVESDDERNFLQNVYHYRKLE